MSDTNNNPGSGKPENRDNNIDNNDNKDLPEKKEENKDKPLSPDEQELSSETNEDLTPAQKSDKPSDDGENSIGSDEHASAREESHSEIKNDETGKEENASEDPKDKDEQTPVIPPVNTLSKQKQSNYQISLIDENLLKINVSTDKGVKINSVVKDSSSTVETQSNEIYLNPRYDLIKQEVEVLIAIDESVTEADDKSGSIPDVESTSENSTEEPVRSESSDTKKDATGKSNYQINLINENLLRIKIITGNSVRIDSISRDKTISSQTQSNKIFLKPKNENEIQEIEITVAIEEAKDSAGKGEDGKPRLIPNPEVIDLIQPPDYSSLGSGADEIPGYKNPFDNLRHTIRRNLTIGITAAVILHLAVAAFAFFNIKKTKDEVPEEQSRLIVLQDLPDPKIRIENIEDPNKPKVEPPPDETDPNKVPERQITPRKTIRPPSVTRPKRETTEDVKLDSLVDANMTRQLDSLRRLNDSTLASLDSGMVRDTTGDTSSQVYVIPDSLKNSFNESDIGLAMYFPKNWKLTDQRDINKNETEFKGVVLTDTTAEQPGTMTMFIFLDSENKDYNAEDFKTEFTMNDSTLSAFVKEPKTLAGFTEYRFYIFNKLGTEKLSMRASVRKQFFDQYKNEIEAVVRSLSIRKKEDL